MLDKRASSIVLSEGDKPGRVQFTFTSRSLFFVFIYNVTGGYYQHYWEGNGMSSANGTTAVNGKIIDDCRDELSIKFVNGANFILVGAFSWIPMAIIWMLDLDMRAQAGISWLIGLCFLPFAFVAAKIFKIPLSLKENPLASMPGLLNAAQYVYMPLLGFMLIKYPQLFLVVLPTVTGAHFFLFGWVYRCKLYYAFSWLIVVVVTVLGYVLPEAQLFIIPLAMFLLLAVLGVLLIFESRKKKAKEDTRH
jgi:hypothetical protein